MSLPERIRVFILKSPATGKNHAVTFDAGEAVRLKMDLRARGVEVDLEERIATRGFQSTGEIEFRCLPCHSHHVISVEAVDGPSEVHDGCCDAASKRAMCERNDLGPVNSTPNPCEDGHDPEDVEVEHQDDDVPVSMNAFTDAIRTKRIRTELVTTRCKRCGIEDYVTRDCKCGPDI